ncbi:MAG: DUF3047 domain-containing protein [Desulfarculus sp.]|nr:DUF3047 domain-containing protein [Desulfarculus sp.]
MAMVWLLALLMAAAGPAHAADASEIKVGHFSASDLAGWEEKVFKGHTRYELVQAQGRVVLRAEAQASASALIRTLRLDLRRYPRLRWSWKIEGILPQGDERGKAGDDYAARVYVVFPSALFWRVRAINYIWANRLPQGQHLPNAFSANAVMLAVRSGPEQAGQWLSEERDVLEDYRRLFGGEPPEMGAVAVMTDADNTGGRAVAYYGDISLAARGLAE